MFRDVPAGRACALAVALVLAACSPHTDDAARPVEISRDAAPPPVVTPAARIDPGTVTATDRAFLTQAAAQASEAVAACQLAEERAGRDPVRRYAAALRVQQARVLDELKAMAALRGVPLPTTEVLPQPVEQLRQLQGADLDLAFLESTGIQGLREAIQLHEDGAAGAGDPQLKAFAERQLPALRQQLATAQQLRP